MSKMSKLREQYTIGCDPFKDSTGSNLTTIFVDGKQLFNATGIPNSLRDCVSKYYNTPMQEETDKGVLTISKLRGIISDIFNRPLPKTGQPFKLGMLTYAEISAITNITEEEYENSSKAYWVGNAITSKQGYEDFLQQLYDKQLLIDFVKL